jgi:hypothetical protein
MTDFLGKKFDTFKFEGRWASTFGEPEKNFKMCIWGASGNGKTDFCVQFSKYLTQFGKVYYNSFEEGVSKSLQAAFNRHEMMEVKGKIIVGDRETFPEVMQRLRQRNSPHFTIIDSLDYMNFKKEHYKLLVETFPHKSFIFISWQSGSEPKTAAAKDIKYMSDIKVHVKLYNAYPMCRYGGNEVFNIWDKYKLEPAEKPKKPTLPTLFDQEPQPSPSQSLEQ